MQFRIVLKFIREGLTLRKYADFLHKDHECSTFKGMRYQRIEIRAKWDPFLGKYFAEMASRRGMPRSCGEDRPDFERNLARDVRDRVRTPCEVYIHYPNGNRTQVRARSASRPR
jgi:hypothetical protein